MTLSRLYGLRGWQVVWNECIPGMSPDSFEWITSKLGVRTYQRLAKTLGFPAQQRRIEKKKKGITSVVGAR
jgi:hypothetical protein